MDYVYLGKIVNTHGIKGELRIISEFDAKRQVFKKDFKIYIGKDKQEEVINSYRVHKNYDMITLVGYNDINEVLKYKGLDVYINRNDLEQNTLLINDLINYKIVNKGKNYGIIKEIRSNKKNYLLLVEYSDKYYYIPYVSAFIKKIDKNKQEIEVDRVLELL